MNIGSNNAGRNTNAGRNPMGGGRANNQTQRQGNQSGINSANNPNRAPKTGGPSGLGFAGDYPNTFGGVYDFGRDPFAPVNGTYTNSAGDVRGMSGREGVRDGIYTNYENNNYKWLGSDRGRQILSERYASPEQALNTKIGDRQHDMAGGDWGAYLSMINSQNGQVGLGAIQKAQSRGATQDQLDRFFTHSGINVGQAAKDAGFGTNPYTRPGSWGNPETAQTAGASETGSSASGISNQNRVGGNLRAAAGANNVLSNKELLQISKANKKDPEKILERAVGRGMLIGSGVVNKYQKGRYTDPRTMMARSALPGFAMAAGMDSPILQQLRNAGRQDKGSALFIGSRGSTATTLPRRYGAGTAFRPPGGNANTAAPTGTGTAGPTTIGTAPVSTTPMTPTEMADASTVSGPGLLSGGGMGAAGASKLGRANSRLRKLGINSRGTSLLGRGLQYGSVLNA